MNENDTPIEPIDNPQSAADELPATWDDFLDTQPETVRNLFDDHVAGLKSALQKEREAAREGQAQLKQRLQDMSGKLKESDAQLKQQLDDTITSMAMAERRAEFYEVASQADVSNLRLAWTAAQSDGLIEKHTTRTGVRWEQLISEMQEAYPELFKQKKSVVPIGNAGSGTQQQPERSANMNDQIRRMARR